MRIRKALLGAVAALALTASLAVLPASAADDWKIAFNDDFSGSGLPGAGWLIDEGTGYPGGPQNGFGTDEVEVMTRNLANLHQQGGYLWITPTLSAGHWSSGRIETKDVFKPADGGVMRIESRLALPDVHGAQALGYWPAFWAMGASQRGNRWIWPASGEFDMAESVNGINKIWSTLHCGYAAQFGGPCGEPVGLTNGGIAPASGDAWGQQHVYALEWDRSGAADQLRWYVDGNLVYSVNQSQVPADVWASMTGHAGYFVLLNVAMGGQFPAALGGGPTAATRPGMPMVVDYVKVAYKGGATPTPTPTSPAPSPTTSSSPVTSPTPRPTPSSTPSGSPSASGGCSPSPSQSPPPADPKQTAVIEAENYATQSGVLPIPGAIEVSNGDNAGYDVQFGTSNKASVVARVASGVTNGSSVLVEVRLDASTAAPIGSFAVANTGGWSSFRDVPANITPTSGKHRVYLTFKSDGDAAALHVDKFTFGETPSISW
jgi:beta-glucanase (GH16 family)